MSLENRYDFSLLKNEYEALVLEELEAQLLEEDNKMHCKCQDCILDMAAYALNNLKPAYRSSFTGVIYAQALRDEKHKIEVSKIVAKAIEKIHENPSHEIEDESDKDLEIHDEKDED